MNNTLFQLLAACLALYVLAVFSTGSRDSGIQLGERIDTINGVQVYQSGENKETITLLWRGAISRNMGSDMVVALKKYRRSTNHFMIDISSMGGKVRSGEVLIKYLEKMKPHYKIETRVPKNGECLSMCVPIFLVGEKRFAGSSTRFMFHRPSVQQKKFGSSVKEVSAQRRYQARLNPKLYQEAKRFFNVHFKRSPIDRRWLKQLEEQWKIRGNDYWTNGENLVREKSNIISDLL